MPSLRELLSCPLSRPALRVFLFCYTLCLFHILLCILLWVYVPYFKQFFTFHFDEAVSVFLFSLDLTLGFTLLLDYQYKQNDPKE